MFRPKPGQILHLGEHRYRVLPHPASPAFPYGQEGRMAVVYKLERDAPTRQPPIYRAFKVFKASYRTSQIEIKAKELKQFGHLPGLQAAIRRVISPNNPIYKSLIATYPDLAYSVLMPWVPGKTWGDIMLQKRPLTREQAWALAWNVLYVLRELEKRQMAHCDLAAANVMIEWRGNTPVISLVDVEQLYAPGLTPPESLLVGSPGYMPAFDQNELWGPFGDRFAGAILLSELLAWYHPDVVQHGNEQSFFAASEIHQTSERYHLMRQALRKWGNIFEELFLRAWHASSLEECAPFQMWEQAFRGELTSLQTTYAPPSTPPPAMPTHPPTQAEASPSSASPEVEVDSKEPTVSSPEQASSLTSSTINYARDAAPVVEAPDAPNTQQQSTVIVTEDGAPSTLKPEREEAPEGMTSQVAPTEIVIEGEDSLSFMMEDVETVVSSRVLDDPLGFESAMDMDSTQFYSQSATEVIEDLVQESSSKQESVPLNAPDSTHTQLVGLEAPAHDARLTRTETPEQIIEQLWEEARRALQQGLVPRALQLYNEAINLSVQQPNFDTSKMLDEYNKIIFDQISQVRHGFYKEAKLDKQTKSMDIARQLGYWLGGLAPAQLAVVLAGIGIGAALFMYLISPLIGAPFWAMLSLGTALLAMLLPMFQKPPVVTAIYSLAVFMGWIGNVIADPLAERPKLILPMLIAAVGSFAAAKGIEWLGLDVYEDWIPHMLWSASAAMLVGILIDELAYPSYMKVNLIEAWVLNFLLGITFWYIGDRLREVVLAFREASSR